MSNLSHLPPCTAPSPTAITQFKQLFKARFRRELSDAEAEDLAIRFLHFFILVHNNENSSFDD
jgi:hypothetical protein